MDHSPLRLLSGELRNIIYDYLWPDQGEVIICLCGSHHPLRSRLRNPKADEVWTCAGSHLPKVCRQLRRETLGYSYSVNSFVLPLHYILQAGGQTRLEVQWERFVRIFGAEMVRQIKLMTVLAGKVQEISVVDKTPSWESAEWEGASLNPDVISEVDKACVFAGRFIRPCLHPAAQMLVLIEHQSPGGEMRSWIDFDDPLKTADRFRELARAPDPDLLFAWTELWPILLRKWFVQAGVLAGFSDDASNVGSDRIE